MSGDVQLMLMLAGMHLLGLVCAAALLLPALRGGPDLPPRGDHDSDEGWGHGPRRPPSPFDLPTGGLPLPDAVQSRCACAITGGCPSSCRGASAAPPASPIAEPVRCGTRAATSSAPGSPRRS